MAYLSNFLIQLWTDSLRIPFSRFLEILKPCFNCEILYAFFLQIPWFCQVLDDILDKILNYGKMLGRIYVKQAIKCFWRNISSIFKISMHYFWFNKINELLLQMHHFFRKLPTFRRLLKFRIFLILKLSVGPSYLSIGAMILESNVVINNSYQCLHG